jgi:type I restriction enzyme S subunit
MIKYGVTISDIIAKKGLFNDGDWVESKDQDQKGEVRLIQLADIGDGVFLNKSNRYLTKKKAIELKCTFLQKGDVLIARMPDPLGRACVFPGNDRECVTVVDVCIIRPNSIEVFNDYLKYLINNYDFRNKIIAYTTGATRKRISTGNLNNIRFDLPEYIDQIRIASVLTRAEKLIAKRKESIKALDEFLKSTFLEMFGDPVRNEKGWENVRWDILFKMRTGKLNANAMSDDGKYPFFTCAKEIYKIDNYDFDCEALILAGNNATADYDVKYYKGKFNAYQRTYILELSKTEHSYRFYQYHLEYKLGQLKDGSKGANTRYLTKQMLDPILFLNPPSKLQNKFAAIVSKVEFLKSKYSKSLTELENLYGSLSQRAFKGELDLSRVPVEG